MITRRGWWSLDIEGVDELNDNDREHIAQKITEGFLSGEIIQEDDGDIVEDIRAAFEGADIDSGCHEKISVDFEHGQWFITCLDCGAQWAANEAENRSGEEYYHFDRISFGDEYCYDKD